MRISIAAAVMTACAVVALSASTASAAPCPTRVSPGDISSLYDAGSGLEGIDFTLMRAQTRAFTDLVLRMGTMSRAEIAGRVTAMRARRAAGAPTCMADL